MTVRINIKGQVTIPKSVREALGLKPGDEVEFEVASDHVRIRKKRTPGEHSERARRAIELLRGSATLPMSTDEIMALTRGWGEPDPGFMGPSPADGKKS